MLIYYYKGKKVARFTFHHQQTFIHSWDRPKNDITKPHYHHPKP
jgi:hypothetical protein